MNDIAAALNISKKTLYKAFAAKDELVQEVVSERLDTLEDECRRAVTHARNAVELLTQRALGRPAALPPVPERQPRLEKVLPGRLGAVSSS